jgi:hypothetical protein
LVDRTLLSPSPSPSLPVLRSTPNTFGSRPSSRAASIVSAASLARHQVCQLQCFPPGHHENAKRCQCYTCHDPNDPHVPVGPCPI